jgi:hypothetical protein
MAHLRLDKALGELPGVRKDGTAFLLSEEADITLYASLGEEVLQIARVARVDVTNEMIAVSTHKGERFYLPPERLIVLKAAAPQRAVSGSAGFRA